MSVNTLAGRRLVVERMGHKGDGVAAGPAGPVFIPYALPGETVTAEVDGERGRLVSVEIASSERVPSFCRWFETCGGCAIQHWDPERYAAWKRDLLVATLRQAGLEAPVNPLVPAHGEGRRRVILHARRGPRGGSLVGFMAARSHDIVAIDRCPLVVPALADAVPVATAIADLLTRDGKPLDIQVTATAGGLDVDVRGHGPVEGSRRQLLVGLAERLDLARLSVHGDVVVERRPPLVRMGRTDVPVPPGGFLQATAAGEDILGGLVTAGVGKAKDVADLFAGTGPFALRLAETAKVLAVESDSAAMAALDRAARHAGGLKPVRTETRDLFRRPLVGPELAGFDAVVFDPPRAGAEAQARALAASAVPKVVAVSCNAATFARDAGILVRGGYRLAEVTPVDQFQHSAHVEIVGVFEKPRAARPRRALG